MKNSESETADAICQGELVLVQPRRGYRFNVDSIILADFIARRIPEPDRFVDLGAGCGVIGLLLAKRWERCHGVLVELQEELARLSRINVTDSGMSDRVEVVCEDLRDLSSWPTPPPQLVASNPPFFRRGAGRPSADPQVACAKHELQCALGELLYACARGVAHGGSVVIIHLMERLDEILEGMKAAGLSPVEFQGVRPLPGRACIRVIVNATRGTEERDIEELEPLLVERCPGSYSSELRRILKE